ncbi:MAG: CvpA family protein [Cytophagales bacterium]|nr:MAG: CvpA family protein [Cytophagales bacterium]TAF62299.1 MAG: CvpA family protein [Cytophagales bacterium]
MFPLAISSVTFHLWDLVFLAIIVFGAYRGYQKGLLVELISLIGFLFTVFFAFKLVQLGFSASKVSSKATAFFMLSLFYLGVVIFVNWIGRLLAESLQYSVFDNLDNYVGTVLGLIKYVLALGVGLLLLNWAGFVDSSGGMGQTYFYGPILAVLEWFLEVFSNLTPLVMSTVQDLKDLLR